MGILAVVVVNGQSLTASGIMRASNSQVSSIYEGRRWVGWCRSVFM
jgi:hypothetical protein